MKLRIVFRDEGTLWNAYIAKPDTIQEAMLIGSIPMTAIVRNPELKDRFIDLMKDVTEMALNDIGVKHSEWATAAAPEHERGGHA